MDNKTINPNYTCNGCLYEDLLPTDIPCTDCARNNLSGYYNDLYVDIMDIDNFRDLSKL